MNLWSFLWGISEYTVGCKKAENLINAVGAQTDLVKIRRCDENTLILSCFYKDRKKFEKKLYERNAEILNAEHSGLPFIITRNKHRAGLVIGFVMALIMLYVSSFYVWDIRVEGNENVPEREITDVLYEIGFAEGVKKKSVDIQTTIDRFLIKESRISWMMINFDGTVAHVEVKEAKRPTLVEKKKNVNLIAKHNGIILRADTIEGSPCVKSGDTVTKGQMLISAFVDRKNGTYSMRGARGYVWAETVRRYGVSVPYTFFEKEYTGEKSIGYEITFFGRTFGFDFYKKSDGKLYDVKVTKGKPTVYKNKYLPFFVKKSERREYREKQVKRTVEEAKEICRTLALERLKSESPMFVLADENVNFEEGENGVFATYEFMGVENIAEKLEFAVC